MKLALPRGQQWLTVIVIAVFVLYLGNHLWTHRDITWRWKEEVLFADGSRIWIERGKVTEARGGGEPFTNSRGVKTNQIIFQDEERRLIWDFPQAPVILERGVTPIRWTVIAIPRSCAEERLYGPYVQYEYLNGQWSIKRTDEKWHGKRANLLGDFENTYEQQAKRVGKSFSAEQIREFNDRIYDAAKEQVVVNKNYKSYCVLNLRGN